jgi:neurotransmitter:Na+ symporter, NSS family
MKNIDSSLTEHWSSKWAFILAASGSAVGLGNIWKFPYITGENGGGAFVLVYIACVLIVGIPLLIAEIAIGRRGGENPVDAIKNIAIGNGISKYWQVFGWIGLAAAFLILSYYNVVAGWTIDYVFKSMTGSFNHLSPQQVGSLFNDLLSHPSKLILYYTIMILITGVIVARGINKGIEKSVKFLFPLMFLILITLVFYAMKIGFFAKGVSFLFHPNFAKLTTNGFLMALGHAFFTLSLGIGSIMMYGAYLPKNISIGFVATTTAVVDTVVALLAGLAIFPIVFAYGLAPDAGPGLIFKTLPLAFTHLPYGSIFETLFFIMLAIAAITSTISLLEPIIAMLIKRTKSSRVAATIYTSIALWFVGLLSLFSFNIWQNVKLLGHNLFDIIDYITANLMLTTTGLLTAIFLTWALKRSESENELNMHPVLYKTWYYTLRYISPVAIIIVLAHGIIS